MLDDFARWEPTHAGRNFKSSTLILITGGWVPGIPPVKRENCPVDILWVFANCQEAAAPHRGGKELALETLDF